MGVANEHGTEQKKEVKNQLKKKKEPPKPCTFSKQLNDIKKGICGSLGGCMVDNVYYFGSSCQWKDVGDVCQIESRKMKTIHGRCSPGGHCKTSRAEVSWF